MKAGHRVSYRGYMATTTVILKGPPPVGLPNILTLAPLNPRDHRCHVLILSILSV